MTQTAQNERIDLSADTWTLTAFYGALRCVVWAVHISLHKKARHVEQNVAGSLCGGALGLQAKHAGPHVS